MLLWIEVMYKTCQLKVSNSLLSNKVDALIKMRELELESEEETKAEIESDEDCDTCDTEELDRVFQKCELISEKQVANKKYILNIGGTIENNPNVAVNLSNNICEVYNLSNEQFAKLAVFTEHTDVITEVKFSHENSNLVYTSSSDGSVRLWDLRIPEKSTVQFTDSTAQDKVKQLTCFDISPNNVLLAAGTNLFAGDAFILFWDLRKHTLLGGYWESHTDDITQVKFHTNNPNRLISGSTDGLINLYELSESSEEDALIDSLNTESSIEKLGWLQQKGTDIISCVTHTADVQFWKPEDAQPYYHLSRFNIAKEINRVSQDFIFVVDVHGRLNDMLVLAGSNYQSGDCFRGLSVVNTNATAAVNFPKNKQLVRSSWFNNNTNLLLTGGEKGILNAWEVKPTDLTWKRN